MKRLLFKSFVVVVFVFFAGNYLVYLKTGQMPLRDLSERMGSDWRVDLGELLSPGQLATDAKEAVKSVADRVSAPETVAPVKIYKWKDENGQVHFSDKPITNGAEQVEIEMRNAISEPESGGAHLAAQSTSAVTPASESALDKARAAAEAMRRRTQQQEQLQ